MPITRTAADFYQRLDELQTQLRQYERVRMSEDGSVSVKENSKFHYVQNTIRELIRSALQDLLSINTMLWEAFDVGIPWNTLGTLHAERENMQLHQPDAYAEEILALLEVSHVLYTKLLHQLREGYRGGKDRDDPEEKKRRMWRSLARRANRHSSATNSLSEEGWPVGAHDVSGPRLIISEKPLRSTDAE